ncbi:MAG: DUF1292 domain-containing protein [Clostridia bacterium]|nr:DUF1292 domain-containing protein [Clostridia bacterium]
MENPDLLDVLFDKENTDPIILMDENGRQMAFEQVAVIPYEKNKKLYCVLKPLDEIEGIASDECIIFRVDIDDNGNSAVRVETDERIAMEIYTQYLDMLAKDRYGKK